MVNQILHHNSKRDMESTSLVLELAHSTEMPVPLQLPLQMPLNTSKPSAEDALAETTFQGAVVHPKSPSRPPSDTAGEDELDDESSDDDGWENDSLILDSLEQLNEDHFFGAGMSNTGLSLSSVRNT